VKLAINRQRSIRGGTLDLEKKLGFFKAWEFSTLATARQTIRG
jgi:hypothetical protein